MEPQINLTHLKYFLNAATNRSVSAAARENFVSQSAISQGIFKLEEALQVKLTTHQKQGFQLTEEGNIVYKGCQKIFTAVDGLKNQLHDLKNEIAGTVTFACTHSIAQFYLAQHYARIKKQYPLVKLKFQLGGMKFLHDALKDEQVSFVIAIDSLELDAYDKEVLKKGCFRFFKKREGASGEGLLIDHYESDEVKELKCRYLNKYKKELIVQEALSGWAMVEKFVQNGCGIGFLPDFITSEDDLLEEVNFKIPLIKYEICIFKLKGTSLSRASKAVIELLKGHSK